MGNGANQKLSVGEKTGYALGDFSANLIFQTLLTFLAFYYTDVYKIPAKTAAAIIFAGGIVGAFFNILMGIIADRTVTRWGKFRPWILWTSVPFGVFAILAFTTPDFNPAGKIAYALITYILLVLIYSANNLPYASLSGVLTGDMKERNSISSYRFVAVMLAQFTVQVLLLPLVLALGGGDKTEGFRIVMTIFAIVGTIFFIITFLSTRERIIPTPEQRGSVGQDLKDLFRNKPWIAMLFLTVFVFITLALKGGSYVYYFKDFLDETSLAGFLNRFGIGQEDPATTGFSLFNAGGIVMMIVGIVFSKPLADRFGKRDIYGLGLFLSALTLILFMFYSPRAVTLVFITQVLHGFFYGLTIPLLWAMIADVADYSEWKNNRRATAITFSAMIFGLKAGLAFGGALIGWILGMFGYNADLAMQNEATVNGIRLAVSIFPGIIFLLATGCLFFYEINKKMETKIEKELSERRTNR